MQGILNKLTGGRPMKKMEGQLHTIDSEEFYEDKFGRVWLAKGPWSVKRTRSSFSLDEAREMLDLFG